MTEDEMKLDMLVAELEYENRLLRARNERLIAEAQRSWPRGTSKAANGKLRSE